MYDEMLACLLINRVFVYDEMKPRHSNFRLGSSRTPMKKRGSLFPLTHVDPVEGFDRTDFVRCNEIAAGWHKGAQKAPHSGCLLLQQKCSLPLHFVQPYSVAPLPFATLFRYGRGNLL